MRVEQEVVHALQRRIEGHEERGALALALEDDPFVPRGLGGERPDALTQGAETDGVRRRRLGQLEGTDPALDVVFAEERIEPNEHDLNLEVPIGQRGEHRVVHLQIELLARVVLLDVRDQLVQRHLVPGNLEHEAGVAMRLPRRVELPRRRGLRRAMDPALGHDP